MKITKEKLKQIIKEEIQKVSEQMAGNPLAQAGYAPPEEIPAETGGATGPPSSAEIFKTLIEPFKAWYRRMDVSMERVFNAAKEASPDRESWNQFLAEVYEKMERFKEAVTAGEMAVDHARAQAIAELTDAYIERFPR